MTPLMPSMSIHDSKLEYASYDSVFAYSNVQRRDLADTEIVDSRSAESLER